MRIIFEPSNSDLEQIEFTYGMRTLVLKRGQPSVELPDEMALGLLKSNPEKFRPVEGEKS